MPTPIVVLFYLWLTVSVVVLIGRLVTRKGRRAKVVRSSAHEPTIPLDWAPTDVSARPTPPTPPPTPPPSARTPGPAIAAAAGARSASLMEALAGITLPCDLLPLTSVEGRALSARDLLLITNGHSSFEVGRAMGEAVAALGYSLTPMANNDLVAARGNDRITIVIHDRPEGLLSGKRQEFPTAKAGDVIVELRL